MRVAVIVNSISAGIRIAEEIEKLPNVDIFLVVCNVGRRSPLLRWARELWLALKSFKWATFAVKVYAYAQHRKLIILRRPLDDSKTIQQLKSLNCDVGLHAAHVIYREPVISAFEMGILNAHIGILPKYRGRSVVEWSILQGDPTGVTVFFIDSGIDTGRRIVLHKFVAAEGWTDVGRFKEMLFGWDARLYRKALEGLMQPGFQFKENSVSEGQRYYVMSKMFTQVANKVVSKRADIP